MTIKQGDAYSVPVSVKLNNAEINIDEVELVEFFIGTVRKVYPDDVMYTDGFFYVPLTQAETFAMPANSVVELDVRVKFIGGNVEGIQKKENILIVDASSEVEL